MPMTPFIDRDGKIAVSHIGLVDKAAFERRDNAELREGSTEGVR